MNPTAAGAGAIALWAVLGVLTAAAEPIPPLQLTAMAFAVGGVAGLLWLAARHRLDELRQGPLAWLHGVGGLFGFHALYFAALAMAPKAEANLVDYTWPLLIVLLSAPILGLRLTRGHLAGVALAALGCALLLAGGSGEVARPGAWLGILAACGSSLIWALYSVLAGRLKQVPTGAIAGFSLVTAVLAGLCHTLFEETVTPGAIGLLSVLALGLGPIGAAFWLWDVGMKRGDPRLLGTLAYVTPVVSTLLLGAAGYAVLTTTVLVSAALVAAGGLIAARRS